MIYLAILLALVWNFVLGCIWYSEWAFGPAWRKYVGFKKSKAEVEAEMKKSFVLEGLGSLVLALSLSYVVHYSGLVPPSLCLFVGALLLGGTIKHNLSRCAWEGTPLPAFFIQLGAATLTFTGMYLIIFFVR